MAGSALSVIKTALIPLLVAAALYLLLSYLIIPLYRRYRADIARYSQYAPLTSTLQSTTSIFSDYIPEALQPRSIRQKLGDWLVKTVIPSVWALRNRGRSGRDQDRRHSASSSEDDGGLFDEESGEAMVGFDMDSRRRGGERRRVGGLGIRDTGEGNAINAAVNDARHADEASTRRLSRDLEEGFRDDSASDDSEEEVTIGRRRLSMASSR